MSKILEIKSCYYCKHYLSPFHCELLKRSVRSKGIHPDCPLPDKNKMVPLDDVIEIIKSSDDWNYYGLVDILRKKYGVQK